MEKHGTAREAIDENITGRMRFQCWSINATETHSEYVILIAFPRQKRFHKHASILRLYVLHIACLAQSKLTFGHQKVYISWLLTSSCTTVSYDHTATMLSDVWPYFPVFYGKVLL